MKKLFPALILLALLLLLLPSALAAGSPNTVSELSITGFVYPEMGDAVSDNLSGVQLSGDACGCKITGSMWYYFPEDGGNLIWISRFTEVHSYTCRLEISNLDFETRPFAEDVRVTVNGQEVFVDRLNDYRIWVFCALNYQPTEAIPIDQAHFPNVVFRSYISSHIDNGDGALSNQERYGTYTMDLANLGDNLVSLRGIEYFPYLRTLNCSGNRINALDLSQNIELRTLDCSYNNLRSLDVSPVYPYVSRLKTLNCSGNPLTSLNVSKATKLTELRCIGASLGEVDLTKNTALEAVYCENAGITQLSLGTLGALAQLSAGNNDFSELDIRGCPKLVDALVDGTYTLQSGLDRFVGSGARLIVDTDCDVVCSSYTAINGKNFPDAVFRAWVRENADANGDKYLSPSDIAATQSIVLSSRGIASLKGVEYFTELTKLIVWNNSLTELDVSKNAKLEYLNCWDNQLTNLDVWNLTELKELRCGVNRLTSLYLGNNPKLELLSCYDNQIRELDISHNPKIYRLQVYINPLSLLYLCYNENMREVDMYEVSMESLSLALWPTIQDIVADGEPDDDPEDDIARFEGQQGYIQVSWDLELRNTGRVPIDATTFPDAGLLQYFEDNAEWLDLNGDGGLSRSERAKITELEISCWGVEDLTGLQYMTSLEYLNIEGNPVSGTLDITPFPALKDLRFSDTGIDDLNYDADGCLVETVYCLGDELDDLYFLAMLPNLKELDLSYSSRLPDLSALDLSDTLQRLNLDSCHLSDKEILNALPAGLVELNLGYNDLSGALDVSRFTKMERLYVLQNDLTAINLPDTGYLRELDVRGNRLAQLYLGNQGALKSTVLYGDHTSGSTAEIWSTGIDGKKILRVDSGTMVVTDEREDVYDYVDREMFLPRNVTAIEESAYEGTAIEALFTWPYDVSWKPKLKKIGGRAFANCDCLAVVQLTEGVTSIASDAFQGSENVHIETMFDTYAMWYAYQHGIPVLLDPER